MTSDSTSRHGTANLLTPEPTVPAGSLPAAMALPPLPVRSAVAPCAQQLPRATSRTRRRAAPARWFSRHRFALDVLLGATLMVLVHTFVVQISVVKGHSMEPSLLDGDRLVVDRVAYDLADVRRGEVVVLRYPRNPQVDFVKRIIGLPGDRIGMRDGCVFVNGEVFELHGCCIRDHEDMAERVVPDGSYFVLGDNRPISCDSREFGLVAAELLKGRVRVRFWPLDRLAVF